VAFALARQVYLSTESLPRQEEFGLKSQMRRAAVSIASNLAEGAGRTGKREFAQFVTIARGSLNELETQYLLAVELGYVSANVEVEQTMERLYGLLNGLRNSLNAER
jgi:four helix bundle protein